MSYAAKFADRAYCLSELAEARSIMGTKPFTLEKGEGLIKGLALMLFHCPEDLRDGVEAHIHDCTIRMRYALTTKEALDE